MKSTINNLDIISLLRFLLRRNVLFSSLFFLSFHLLSSFFFLSSSNAHFCQSAYLPSIFSNSFLIYSSIPPQTFDHPTHTVILPYTFPVTSSFCTHLLLPPIFSLLSLFSQTLQSILLHFSNFLSSPKYSL